MIDLDVLDCINKLDKRIRTILPEYLKGSIDILSVAPIEKYLNDFCLMMCESNIKSFKFLMSSIAILSKGQIDSISFIYGVYWRMEKMLMTSLSFVNQVTEVFEMEHELLPVLQASYQEIMS